MKNPFKKEKHTGAISAIAAGVIIAGAVAWLFLTESGEAMLEELKEGFKDKAAELISKKTIIPKKAAKAATDAVM